MKRLLTWNIKDINRKRYKKIYKTLTSRVESVDTVVNIGATTTSVNLSVTGVGLIGLQIAAGFACALWLGDNVIHKITLKKYNKYKNQVEKDKQTLNLMINFIGKVYKIIALIIMNMNLPVKFLKNNVDEKKNEAFHQNDFFQ